MSMNEQCPRCRRVDEGLLFVNKNKCRWCDDALDLVDASDYIGLADPESVARFFESRHISVTGGRRNDA
jgi:hypothetical protein